MSRPRAELVHWHRGMWPDEGPREWSVFVDLRRWGLGLVVGLWEERRWLDLSLGPLQLHVDWYRGGEA